VRKLVILIFSLQLYSAIGFGKDDNANKDRSDSTYSEVFIFIKFGYFPFYEKLQSAGIFGSISTNGDFQSAIDFGWYISLYGGIGESRNTGGLIFGGFNLGKKFNFNKRYLIINLASGLAFSGTYPAIANILEFNFPLLFLFERSSLGLSISCGLIRFTTVLPITFSLSYSF
jgi:hypothetical protein